MEHEQIVKVAGQALANTRQMIASSQMTSKDKVEFFDTYQDDIIKMIDSKLEDLRKMLDINLNEEFEKQRNSEAGAYCKQCGGILEKPTVWHIGTNFFCSQKCIDINTGIRK